MLIRVIFTCGCKQPSARSNHSGRMWKRVFMQPAAPRAGTQRARCMVVVAGKAEMGSRKDLDAPLTV